MHSPSIYWSTKPPFQTGDGYGSHHNSTYLGYWPGMRPRSDRRTTALFSGDSVPQPFLISILKIKFSSASCWAYYSGQIQTYMIQCLVYEESAVSKGIEESRGICQIPVLITS